VAVVIVGRLDGVFWGVFCAGIGGARLVRAGIDARDEMCMCVDSGVGV
jgi:hypothetical protein